MVDADEAMKRAGDVFNGYSGRHPNDPSGVHAVRRILASLESSGWVCVPREATEEMKQAADRLLGKIHDCDTPYNVMIAAAPRLTGEKR